MVASRLLDLATLAPPLRSATAVLAYGSTNGQIASNCRSQFRAKPRSIIGDHSIADCAQISLVEMAVHARELYNSAAIELLFKDTAHKGGRHYAIHVAATRRMPSAADAIAPRPQACLKSNDGRCRAGARYCVGEKILGCEGKRKDQHRIPLDRRVAVIYSSDRLVNPSQGIGVPYSEGVPRARQPSWRGFLWSGMSRVPPGTPFLQTVRQSWHVRPPKGVGTRDLLHCVTTVRGPHNVRTPPALACRGSRAFSEGKRR